MSDALVVPDGSEKESRQGGTRLADLKAKWLKDDAVREEYEALAQEFKDARSIIEARLASNSS